MQGKNDLIKNLAWRKHLLACTCCFLFSFGISQSQSPNFLKQFSQNHPSFALKTTEHDDLPALCYRLDWNTQGGNWDSTFQFTSNYFPDGKLAELITSTFDNGSFALYRKEIYQYFPSGNVQKYTVAYRNANQWINDTRRDYVYDAQGNEILNTELKYNGISWDSISQFRHTLSYGGNNVIIADIEESRQLLSSPLWEFQNRYEYSLDLNSEWDTLLLSQWDVNAWKEVIRVLDIDFYDFSRELPYAAKYQNFNNGQWLDFQRFNVTYSQYDSQDWIYEEFQNTWDTTQREVITFDAKGHEIRRDVALWAGQWLLNSSNQYTYTYDLDGRTIEWQRNTYNGASLQNNIKKVIPSFFTVGFSEPSIQAALKTWPNPCYEVFHLDLSPIKQGPILIEIYDLKGTLRLSTVTQAGANDVAIEIPSHFENGSYFWTVKSKQGFHSGKLLLQR